jgi:hypothetical protein
MFILVSPLRRIRDLPTQSPDIRPSPGEAGASRAAVSKLASQGL